MPDYIDTYKGIDWVIAGLKESARKGLVKELFVVGGEAQRLAPVDEGNLRDSMDVIEPRWKGDEMEAAISFNEPYAAVQHEGFQMYRGTQRRPRWNRPKSEGGRYYVYSDPEVNAAAKGKGAKYLEKAILGSHPDRAMAEEMRKFLASGGIA